MRGKSMKGKSKKSTYSTTFGVDPKNQPIPQPLVLTQKSTYSTTFGVDPIKKKKPQDIKIAALKMVGVAELESATPCVSCKKCFFALNKL